MVDARWAEAALGQGLGSTKLLELISEALRGPALKAAV